VLAYLWGERKSLGAKAAGLLSRAAGEVLAKNLAEGRGLQLHEVE